MEAIIVLSAVLVAATAGTIFFAISNKKHKLAH
jgi:hypothetical protein